MTSIPQKRPKGIAVVAMLMIVFGLAEIATGVTHNFLWFISTASGSAATVGVILIGALYAIAGALLFTMRRSALLTSLACLALVILGRVGVVLTGLYPTDTFLQTFSIIVGTTIAASFALYIWRMRDHFN